MTDWTRADDLIVGVAYNESGLEVTEALMAALPQHEAGSIRMRLQNFQWLATDGQHGLYKVTESTRWAHDVLSSLASRLPLISRPCPARLHHLALRRAGHLPAVITGLSTSV